MVFDIVVNETAAGDDLDLFGRSEQDEIIVVGAFDTICQTCQAQYCSVVRPVGTSARYLDEREGRMRWNGRFPFRTQKLRPVVAVEEVVSFLPLVLRALPSRLLLRPSGPVGRQWAV